MFYVERVDATSLLDLADRWWNEIWRDGNFDVADEIFADPFVRHSAMGTVIEPRELYKRMLGEFQRTLHRPVTTIDARDVVADRIWTRATSRGLNLESGEPTVVTWMLLQRIDHGRIAEQWALTVRGVDWSA
jgi:hypothetical protein